MMFVLNRSTLYVFMQKLQKKYTLISNAVSRVKASKGLDQTA